MQRKLTNPQSAIRNPQSGYALIAVLGTLTVMLILITGILPSVVQDVKRERETEMLFRGRQIVEAIARYRTLAARLANSANPQQSLTPTPTPTPTPSPNPRGGNTVGLIWPQSLNQLVEGITVRGTTRKVRLLRSFALTDPMNDNNPWKPVGYNDKALQEFLEAYCDHMGQPFSMVRAQLRQYIGVTTDVNGNDEHNSRNTRPRSAFGGPVFGEEGDKPQYIFGVVSESKEEPMRDYYGLEHYNRWVFAYIPELQVVRGNGDQELEMISREIIFPTDPLALGGRVGVMAPPNVSLPNPAAGSGKGFNKELPPTPPSSTK